MSNQVEKTYRFPDRQDQKTFSLWYVIVKFPEMLIEGKDSKLCKRKAQCHL